MPTKKRTQHQNAQRKKRQRKNAPKALPLVRAMPITPSTRAPDVTPISVSAPVATPAPRAKILDEDTYKLQEFGLPYQVCYGLATAGFSMVWQLVEKLKSSNPKIAGIGAVKTKQILESLKSAGFPTETL